MVRREQDRVLAEEAGGERGSPAIASAAHISVSERDRRLLPQAAHVLQVLLAAQAHESREPAPRKSSALKNACVTTWKMPTANAPTPHAEEHVAKLRNRRVRVDLLDVVLHQADGRGHHGRRESDHRDHVHRDVGACTNNSAERGDHVHARGHHRRGVDQCRNRRRTCHRVRQPDIQRNLRRLTGSADEQQQADRGEDPGARIVPAYPSRRANTFWKSRRAEL